jgi:hypothetical protein
MDRSAWWPGCERATGHCKIVIWSRRNGCVTA